MGESAAPLVTSANVKSDASCAVAVSVERYSRGARL